MTDTITLFLSFYFIIQGASRGFMRSLLVPFSILLATSISIIYYQITKDIILSLIIGLIGPWGLHVYLKHLLKKWSQATNTEIKPDFLSRLGGSLLSLAWGWVFIVFTLILLAVLPSWGTTMTAIHNDVTHSASYFFAKPFGENLFPPSKQNAPVVTNTPSSNEAKSLADDPRFQNIIQDPEIQKEIDSHDMVKLMSNPKIIDLTQQIMSDPATMKKVMALYSSQVPALAGDPSQPPTQANKTP